jgi:xanthine dehydrogenase YagS FAD-binding subunit
VRDFAYARAGTAESALGTLADPGTSVIAGGTELLNWFRLGIAAADRVVDIGGLDELRGIATDGDDLRIGALATLNEIGEHPLVMRVAGALASACLQAASAQIRNRATIGGNVLQRTRCPYFRAEEPLPWPCNKREPGSGCTSLAGRHERQAIFGWTQDCVAVQPSDPAVALAMLDARADVLGPAGPRTIPMREFHLTQREAADAGQPMRETRLEPGELITAARVALGSVAQRPCRLTSAEAELPGTPLTREALIPVIERAMADAAPLPQNGFKVTMARNAAVRALLTAGGAS